MDVWISVLVDDGLRERAIDQDADNTKDAVPPMNHFVLVTVRRLPDIYLRLSV